jgi:hypothetical protein
MQLSVRKVEVGTVRHEITAASGGNKSANLWSSHADAVGLQ